MNTFMKKFSTACLAILALQACKAEDMSSSEVKNVNPDSGPYFHEVSFLTSHNAFVNRGDDLWAVSNQGRVTIEDQLKRGVRGLMLDVHNLDGVATLCHSKCFGIPGIFPTQDLSVTLKVVKKFLDNNRNEVVTLHIEDYLRDQLESPKSKALSWFRGKPAKVGATAAFKKALDESGLTSLIFNPYAENVQSKGWPRINAMIAKNKRVLILSSHRHDDEGRKLGLAHDQDFTVENYWSMGGPMSSPDRKCVSRWGHLPLNRNESRFERLFVMNHFRDIPGKYIISDDNKFDSIWGRVAVECLNASGRKPNFVALDRATEGSGPDIVKRLNSMRGIAYADGHFTGKAQFLFNGDLNVKDLSVGNDLMSSLRVFTGSKIALFGNGDFNQHLGDFQTNVPLFNGDLNDKVSSARVR